MGGYQLETVLGLHDLHYVLAGNEDFESFLRRVRGQAISLSESDRIASWAIGSGESARATRLKARVLDQSLGGYRVVWERGPGGEAVRARIGELVGLALAEPGEGTPDWLIGTIRWIRIDEQGRVDAGVELLSRRALPAGVRNADDSGCNHRCAGSCSHRCVPDESDPTSLITPALFERAASMVEISVPADLQGRPAPARTERVRGIGLIEATGIYLQFALPPLDGDAAESVNEATAHAPLPEVDRAMNRSTPTDTALPAAHPRRSSIAVRVGNVSVGGDTPIVVQSMTNTDTADVEGHRQAGGRARARRLGARTHHGQHARSRRRGSAHPRAARHDGLRRAVDRRFSLQRTPAARARTCVRRSAGEIPDQPRQCRLRQEARPAVRDDHRVRAEVRQAGSHRRELGIARSIDGRRADGRESRADRPVGRLARRARGADPLGARFGPRAQRS